MEIEIADAVDKYRGYSGHGSQGGASDKTAGVLEFFEAFSRLVFLRCHPAC